MNSFGAVRTYFESEFDAAAAVRLTCDDEVFAISPEFSNLLDEMTIEIVRYEEPYCTDPVLTEIEEKQEINFSTDKIRIEKSSPFSLLTTYTHRGKIGVIVETAVKNIEAFNSNAFKVFSFDCALHIAAFNPLGVDKSDMPNELQASIQTLIEKELMQTTKPMNLWPEIIKGKVNKWAEERALLHQIFIKSDKETVQDVCKTIGNKIGSPIEIIKFARLALE